MNKKIISMILILTCMGSHALAETTATVKNVNGTVTVKGEAPEGTPIRLTVKSADDDSGYYAIKEAVSDGEYYFEFVLKDRKTNQESYEYLLTVRGDTEVTQKLMVFSEPDIYLDNLTNISADDLYEMLEAEDVLETYKNLGMAADKYKTLSEDEKKNVCAGFVNDIQNADKDELIETINADIAVELSKKADNQADYEEIFADMELAAVEWEKISDFTKKRLYETKNYQNLVSLKNEIALYEALNEVNNAKYSQLEAIFAQKGALLGLAGTAEYTRYTGFIESYKRKVNEEIVLALYENQAQTKEYLLEIFKKAVANINIQTTVVNTGGGSSGSGSSFAGGAGSTGTDNTVVLRTETPVTAPKKAFSDVENDFWAAEAISALANKGIISGYEDGSFKPNDTITREEFVTILVNAFELMDVDSECSFVDVAKDKWYYPYIASGYSAGIVNGISENEFGIGKNIIRQDVAVLIAAALNAEEDAAAGNFADENEISDYAKASVNALKARKIISGRDGNMFVPRAECTRAECASMIAKAIGLI